MNAFTILMLAKGFCSYFKSQKRVPVQHGREAQTWAQIPVPPLGCHMLPAGGFISTNLNLMKF